ncbi:MAG TPA: PEP-CTERM sorting domain-containing protein [Terriglobales bacterium]|nr:PEP-CTERM sorting domain-containing protein [Terriglobales bacterium]
MSDPARSVRVRRSRSSRRRRIRRAVLVFATLGFIYVGAWWAFSVRSSWSSRTNPDQADLKWAQGNLSHNLALLATESVSAPLSLPSRVVYPYSVIPGGVQTPDDLRQVSEHDRMVGSHYAGFDFRNARIVELDQPKLVYLSYRMGGKLFWTGKRISLHKGEKLITDGRMTARTRCANRISETAQPAVSPWEPPAEKFEEPFLGTAGQIPFPGDFNALGPAREFSGLGPAGPPGLQSVNSPPFPGGGLPPVFPPPIPTKGCPPGEILGGNNTCHHHKPPPPPVPEPTTMLLVSSGIAGIYWRRRKAAAKK